jgi:arginine utilization regulatory protein
MQKTAEWNDIDLLSYEDVVIVDKAGIIVFDDLANLSLYDLRPDEVIGKKVTSLYKNLNDENSIFMKVLKDGIPVIDARQELVTKDSNTICQVSSTFPIMSNREIIGAVEFSKFLYKTDSMHLIKKHSMHKAFRKNNTIYTIDDIITENPEMKAIKRRIERIAKTDSTVLIHGKTGTGKELVAQAIHNLSDRCNKPFVSQNCAAIPGTLLESILFGTVKGSFTGAEDHKGLFEQADGGTLFLDEINSMDISIQVKILKAIEEKTIRRVGGAKNVSLDVRIISAINKDPEEAISLNELREDLYFRLISSEIELPALSERKDDISVLIDHFIRFYNSRMNVQIKEIKPDALERLKHYSWPGNIRELRNAVESFYHNIDDTGIVTVDLLSDKIARGAGKTGSSADRRTGRSYRELMEEFEIALIKAELDKTGGNAAQAARNLKMSKQCFKYKTDKYQLK